MGEEHKQRTIRAIIELNERLAAEASARQKPPVEKIAKRDQDWGYQLSRSLEPKPSKSK